MNPTAGRILTLIAGVALGALASGLFFQSLERPARSVETAEPSDPAIDSVAAAQAALPPRVGVALPDHVAEAPVAAADGFARRPVSVVASEDTAESNALLAALHAAYARGELSEEDLVQMLLGVMLAHGNADAALDLVMRFRPHDAAALVQVAVAFSHSGRLDRARELLEQALSISPDDEWVLNQYASVDSGGALPYFLSRLSRQPPPGDPGLRLQIAQLYLSAGNDAGARAQVDILLQANPEDTAALQLLSGMDPLAAERVVRDLIASGASNNDWNGILLQLMLEQGRPEAAVALMDSRRAMGLIPDSGEYGAIAQLYAQQGKPESAIAMWTNAFDSEQDDPDSWTSSLQEYAPEKLLKMLEARTAQGANDEFWGALGDSYWYAGRHPEALNAWREASRQDPKDDEWTTNLAKVAAGLDPL